MNNLRGSLFMVAAMAAFALEDMFIKSAASQLPVGQVLILFGSGGCVIFYLVAKLKREVVFNRSVLSKMMLWRSLSEVGGRLFYTLAIALTPLSNASAILQATPLVVAVGAVIFFGEKVGWRRWVAIFVGFFGVLLILRPGLSGFDPLSIFAVLGTLGFAGRDLATKAAPPTMTNAQLGFFGFAMLIVAGGIALGYSGEVQAIEYNSAWKLGAAIIFGVVAYNFLTNAMRAGDVSVIAPFRYTRLVFAMILGMFVFAEQPDMYTLLGSAIIVVSGLYTVLRERK